MSKRQYATGSCAEDLFVEIFCEAFGEENARFLYKQYHFYDIYQNNRYADFVLEIGNKKIAFEVDDEATHSPRHISSDKFYDDLLRQNCMVYLGWQVYRWAVRQMQLQPETVKDEMRVFLGQHPQFNEIDDYLPTQLGRSIDATHIDLYDHQDEALRSLELMRQNHETIGLLYHATGTGKTVTAITDAHRMHGRTLFLAHTKEIIDQACKTFRELWPEVYTGKYCDGLKETTAFNICASIQSISCHLDAFRSDEFAYLIVDEAHHAAADSYQAVLAYFKPKFTLGLTATPERTDDNKVILDIFKNTAHKLDLETAVDIGVLVPVRCIRIHTNIDISKVRFNSFQYNIRDLESKLYLPERNQLIVDTWIEYVRDKRTIIFCASVAHAEDIASALRDRGVAAQAVSGGMKSSQRRAFTDSFARGQLTVLCACDLLNEGWDCPETEVLFMTRPTMSKILYTQQLGRGMRRAEGKESLMVFDFVDIASQWNMPQSLHRLFRLSTYQPGALALAPAAHRTAEAALYAQGIKPDAIVDYPIHVTDLEVVDLFDWQREAQDMISQMEFVRRINVQSESVERYIKEGKIVADLVVPLSQMRVLRYFKRETLERYAAQFGWTIIDDDNRKTLFLQMVAQMDMTYSYKPVLLKAMLQHADAKGRVNLSDIVSYFRHFYEERRRKGLIVEKPNSIYTRGGYTDKDVERNILANPFRRFEDMQVMHHARTLGVVQFDDVVWRKLTVDDKASIVRTCDEKLAQYYSRNLSS